MTQFFDGPLTGAPINKPTTAMRGDDCPPVILQTGSYAVVGDEAATNFKIYGVFTGTFGTGVVALRATSATNALPVLGAATLVAGAPGELDTFEVEVDTSDPNVDSAFAVQVSADNGCVAEAEVDVVFP